MVANVILEARGSLIALQVLTSTPMLYRSQLMRLASAALRLTTAELASKLISVSLVSSVRLASTTQYLTHQSVSVPKVTIARRVLSTQLAAHLKP